jgi:hypothetical protein
VVTPVAAPVAAPVATVGPAPAPAEEEVFPKGWTRVVSNKKSRLVDGPIIYAVRPATKPLIGAATGVKAPVTAPVAAPLDVPVAAPVATPVASPVARTLAAIPDPAPISGEPTDALVDETIAEEHTQGSNYENGIHEAPKDSESGADVPDDKPISADTGEAVQIPTDGADTPLRSSAVASPLKRANSNDSTYSIDSTNYNHHNDTIPSEEQLVSPVVENQWPDVVQPQPERLDHLPSIAFNQRQKDLVAACWNLDPCAVRHVLSQSNDLQISLNGLTDYYGNSPLQVAVDGLIHRVDTLRATEPENWPARDQARQNFYWVMMQLIERMELPELQNINYQPQRYHALSKLAHWSGDWRLLNPLIEAMTRMSGLADEKGDHSTTFKYEHGATWDGHQDDTHVIGLLVEHFQVRVADTNGIIVTQNHSCSHRVGRFHL